ncbi:hypothetical protein [Roseomonas sp. WA12]
MKIRIGPFDYAVSPADVVAARENDYDGQIHRGRLTIVVDPTIAPQRQAEVLLHEVLHGVWFSQGIPGSDEEEERAVNGLGLGLLQVLRDNPALLGALQAGLAGASIFAPPTPLRTSQPKPPAPPRGRDTPAGSPTGRRPTVH